MSRSMCMSQISCQNIVNKVQVHIIFQCSIQLNFYETFRSNTVFERCIFSSEEPTRNRKIHSSWVSYLCKINCFRLYFEMLNIFYMFITSSCRKVKNAPHFFRFSFVINFNRKLTGILH